MTFSLALLLAPSRPFRERPVSFLRGYYTIYSYLISTMVRNPEIVRRTHISELAAVIPAIGGAGRWLPQSDYRPSRHLDRILHERYRTSADFPVDEESRNPKIVKQIIGSIYCRTYGTIGPDRVGTDPVPIGDRVPGPSRRPGWRTPGRRRSRSLAKRSPSRWILNGRPGNGAMHRSPAARGPRPGR